MTDEKADLEVEAFGSNPRGCCSLRLSGGGTEEKPGLTRRECRDSAVQNPDVVDWDWSEGPC